MFRSKSYLGARLVIFFIFTSIPSVLARGTGTIRGRVLDELGAPVQKAHVNLIVGGKSVRTTQTDSKGNFTLSPVSAGRYRVQAEAAGLSTTESQPVLLDQGQTARVEVVLHVGTLRQRIVVSDTGTALPESQTGASVTVIGQSELAALDNLDVLDVLRQVPGLTVVQTGERGGTTSVFARGGNSEFNKVLIDGIPGNDIGGAVEFANLATSAIDNVEVFRGANSVLYGADALGSVINITTRQGDTPTPELTYSADGGSFGTLRQEGSLGGVFHHFDYFADFMRFDTQNSLPNSSFHNGTFSGNFGWQANDSTQVRFTIRHTATGLGDPNALAFYGVPDTAFQREQDTYIGIKAENQTSPKWHNSLQLTSTRLNEHYDDPSPAGEPFEGNYLGDPVTICGANGYCASGQAILDYGGTYPDLYDSHTSIGSVYAQSDYSFNPDLSASGGFRYDYESGWTNSAGTLSSTIRNNVSTFLEGHGTLGHTAFATVGIGLDDNAVYGFAATPRVSLAYYARRPLSNTFFSGTELRFNFGTGIDEPSIFDQGSSLFGVLSTLPNGLALISKYKVAPIGPERSRNLDFGVDQGLWGGRARLGVTFFHEQFFDLIDFVDKSLLPELGVPAPVAAALPFGATVNSDSTRSRGGEVEFESGLGRGLRLSAEYTYIDAVVTQSFASSAQIPAYNPAFPNIPIGSFSPLVGGRPFRIPPNSGSVALIFSRRRFGTSITGYLTSRSDDSTYLTDAFGGNTLLLPNRDLLNAYQLFGWSGWYDVHRGVTLYTNVGNLLSEHYQAAFGYPALPFTFRGGIRFTLGGEGLRW
jgi:vitamin B12 transporter